MFPRILPALLALPYFSSGHPFKSFQLLRLRVYDTDTDMSCTTWNFWRGLHPSNHSPLWISLWFCFGNSIVKGNVVKWLRSKQ